MEIELVTIDLDGTLLNSKNEIPKETIEIIEKLKKNNIKVVIATGRTFTAAKRYHNELNLKTPLISCNGGFIMDPVNNKIIEGHEIERETLYEIFKIIKNYEVYFQFYTDEKIYSEQNKYLVADWLEENKFLKEEDKIDIELIDDIVKFLDKNNAPVFKGLIIEENQKTWEQLWQEIEIYDNLELVSSASGYIDIMHKGITKGHALERVCEYLDVNIKNTLAIGDNDNDASMLEKAGIGIAVENATEKAKKAADYITDTNENLGVNKAINKFINLK